VGGGAVPRIPIMNVDAMHDAKRLERTMHETKNDTQTGLATARQVSARDDTLPMELALIIVAIP